MLARNVKDRLHEKMGNLTFRYPRKLLIINYIAKSSTCRLFKKNARRELVSGRHLPLSEAVAGRPAGYT